MPKLPIKRNAFRLEIDTLKRISINYTPIIEYNYRIGIYQIQKLKSSKKGSMFVNIINPIPNFSIHSTKTQSKKIYTPQIYIYIYLHQIKEPREHGLLFLMASLSSRIAGCLIIAPLQWEIKLIKIK